METRSTLGGADGAANTSLSAHLLSGTKPSANSTTMPNRGGRAYMAAIAALKARGDVQNCWRCGKQLWADAPKGHPRSITLGHYLALEDGGDLLDPNNHGPECIKCNYGDGARRTNAKRRGEHYGVYINPSY